MKGKLGRTARGWALVLLVLNGALLITIAWVALASSTRRPSGSGTPQPASLSPPLGNESSSATTVRTHPQQNEPRRPDAIRPRREAPATATQARPLPAAPAIAAEPTGDTAAQAKAGILKGMRGVTIQASRPNDGGQTVTN